VRQVTLLGTLDAADLAAEVTAFGVDGPVALVTAGWEEGERNDADVDRRLVAARAISTCTVAASTSSRVTRTTRKRSGCSTRSWPKCVSSTSVACVTRSTA
jgi:hypothetical protein